MIYILTSCSRPQNLPQVRESLLPLREAVTWLVYHNVNHSSPDAHKSTYSSDGLTVIHRGYRPTSDGWHHSHNLALDEIESGWIFILDDDNLMHPDFWAGIADLRGATPSASVLLFGQEYERGVTRRPDPQACMIDIAQVLFERRSAGGLRFETHRGADGQFIQRLVEKNPDGHVSTSRVLSFYNRLRWYS